MRVRASHAGRRDAVDHVRPSLAAAAAAAAIVADAAAHVACTGRAPDANLSAFFEAIYVF